MQKSTTNQIKVEQVLCAWPDAFTGRWRKPVCPLPIFGEEAEQQEEALACTLRTGAAVV
jgi:hypothetical protein